MTNTGVNRSTSTRAVSKAKKILRHANNKLIRMDEAGDRERLAEIQREAYKLESMIAQSETRCELHVTFCTRTRTRREKLGLTQAAVAAKLGVKPNTYAAIEHGRCSPSLETVSRVADALECKPFDLLK
jgi:DNA-binding XRE family transcriptional regulator